MGFVDYDDLVCEVCGHIGLIPDGDYYAECPCCGAEQTV